MKVELRISGKIHKELYSHLYPGDGKEAVAIAICGRLNFGDSKKLLVHKVFPIPYEDCFERNEMLVSWSTEKLEPILQTAAKKGLAILKIHSHPTGFDQFSETDDASDSELFESVYGWMDDFEPHASAIMLPDGKLFGRVVAVNGDFIPFGKVLLTGDDVCIWSQEEEGQIKEFSLRTAQAFGLGTTNLLKRLAVAVVGCSGTGSPVIEQLVRLGVGKLILVDPDIIEEKNLTRIINSTMADATERKAKVHVLQKSIEAIGIGTKVVPIDKNLFEDQAIVRMVASCDVIFGCLDSVDGRHLLNQIATFYLVPYFDLGVKLTADGKGGVEQICGSVHYLQPGGASLLTRNVYNQEDLRAAGLFRTNPKEYKELRRSGYITNVNVSSPAVISVNMHVASVAVLEFLARIHKFRYDSNQEFAVNRVSITDGYYQREEDGTADAYLQKFVGRGDMRPLLNMPEFS